MTFKRLAALLLTLLLVLQLAACDGTAQDISNQSSVLEENYNSNISVNNDTTSNQDSSDNVNADDTTDNTSSIENENSSNESSNNTSSNVSENSSDDKTPDYDFTTQCSHDEDPYVNVNKTEFYANYTPACCNTDAGYRSKHHLLSGSLEVPDQYAVEAENRPKSNGKFVRNTATLYTDGGNTYIVMDADGREIMRIHKAGGYITLEEVAAYVLAFGDIPANYVSSKNATPTNSIWGEYLRLNHSSFSGSTSKYPYEPELPNISGCGGDLYYYEIDLGTTGTDCDPKYDATEYNDGYDITRGAARIVYTRYDKNKNEIIDVNEKYVFYTYNHYNDFQEYLNYEGGWGEMFGNITGGGTLSSKKHYNPTPYVETSRMAFVITNQDEYFAGSTDNVSYILLEKNKEKWYYI